MRGIRAGLVIGGVVLAAACGGDEAPSAVFTEPPFTPDVTLAPTPTSTSGAASVGTRLQFHSLVGQTIVFHVSGFQVGENVTFTVTKPDGASFTGPARPASQTGTVEARYAPPIPGTYTVVAKGDRGTPDVTSQFIVSSSFSAPAPTARPTTTRRSFTTPAPTARATSTPAPTARPTTTP